MSKKFSLYPGEKLPSGFRYPEKLIQLSSSEAYPDIYPWWFIDANSEAGELSYSNIAAEGSCLVPFAKVDDDRNDVACFDGADITGNPRVLMRVLDNSGRSYSYLDFDDWLKAAQADADYWRT